MNRLIAAVDVTHGIADDSGIPWQGRIPSDSQYFVNQTRTGTVVMGYRTYEELDSSIGRAPNLVAVRAGSAPPLRKGFIAVVDLEAAIHDLSGDLVWVIGGAALFRQTMRFADELYITQLEEDFRCTKFFPEFSSDFHVSDSRAPLTEGGIRFQFQIWQRNAVGTGCATE